MTMEHLINEDLPNFDISPQKNNSAQWVGSFDGTYSSLSDLVTDVLTTEDDWTEDFDVDTNATGNGYLESPVFSGTNSTGFLDNIMIAVPMGICLYSLSVLTFVGNAMVLHAIRTERRLQTVSNMFIMSLAIADLTVGMIVMPISSTYVLTGDWRFGLVVCQFWLSADYLASTASILNLLILSLDRYWSVRSPLKYMRKRTKKRALLMIAVVWIVSSLWILPIIAWHWWANEGGERRQPAEVCETEFADNVLFKVTTSTANFYVPMILMIAVYLKIYFEIKKRSRFEIGQCNVGGRTASYMCKSGSVTSLHSANGKPTAPRTEGGNGNSVKSCSGYNSQQPFTGDQEITPTSSSGPTIEYSTCYTRVDMSSRQDKKNKFLFKKRFSKEKDDQPTTESSDLCPDSRRLREVQSYPSSKSFCNQKKILQTLPKSSFLCTICNKKSPKSMAKGRPQFDITDCQQRHSVALGEFCRASEDMWRCETCGRTVTKKSMNLPVQGLNLESSTFRRDGSTAKLSCDNLQELEVQKRRFKDSRSLNYTSNVSGNLKTEDVIVLANSRGECSGSTLSLDFRASTKKTCFFKFWGQRNRSSSRNTNSSLDNDDLETELSDSLDITVRRRSERLRSSRSTQEKREVERLSSDTSEKSSGHLMVPLQSFRQSSFKGSSFRQSSGLLSTFSVRLKGGRKSGPNSLRQEKKAARQLGVIISAFVLCWLPYIVIFIVTACCEDCLSPVIHTATIWLGYFNSTINPLIYALCNANFKRAFWKIAGRNPAKTSTQSRSPRLGAKSPRIESHMFA